MKNKLLIALPVFAVLITLFTACMVITVDAEENVETVDHVTVNWGKNNKVTKHKTTQVVFTATVKEEEPEPEPEQEVKPVDIPWVETDDTDLVNYAEKPVNYVTKDVPDITKVFNTKTYMKYQVLGTEAWNKQGHLSRQKEATTGPYNIRMVDDRYLIAVGTYYCTRIGTYIDVVLEDGTVLPCMLGDVKSDLHTDPEHKYQAQDKSVIEFIVDSPGVNKYDYSAFKNMYPTINGNFSNVPEFSSPVDRLLIYDKIYNIDMSDMSNTKGQ